jgi:hypothetical protein
VGMMPFEREVYFWAMVFTRVLEECNSRDH